MFQSLLRGLWYMIVLPSALVTVDRPIRPVSEVNPPVDVAGYAEIRQNWGPYSPWFSVPSQIAPDVPRGCEVVTVQALSRHGSRGPTSRMFYAYKDLIDRIHRDVETYSMKYEFLKDYRYSLSADNLTSFGRQELKTSGHAFYNRYSKLSKSVIPFIRVSDLARVVESAKMWTQGFHEAKRDQVQDPTYPYPMLIIPEGEDSHNTLHHRLCPAFTKPPYSEIADSAQAQWSARFAKAIQSRLNSDLSGVNLNISETIYMMDLCPYDTVSIPSGKTSPFCDLFPLAEWKQYSYYYTLEKYYGFGAGNPLGPTQGVGYVNEVIARLLHKKVKDHTSSNHTLDKDPNTFPLHRPLYVDFSHDNEMTGIMFALGLYSSTPPLLNSTLENENLTGGYSASYTVPFAARIYIESLKCEDAAGEMVRVIVNDRVLPLESCGDDERGLCTLDKFVKSLSFAMNGGKWDMCFV